VTDIVGRVRDAPHDGDAPRIDTDSLINRLRSMIDFIEAVDGHLPDERLVGAHTLIERAGTRLALSGDHTVVALVGATASGKSSLFNRLARLDVSPVGVRRPTTGIAYACVWGPMAGAADLLDWVGVLPRHRFVRESKLDGEDEAALRGLVLLDLPGLDSVEHRYRVEVDRLLSLVDLMVWVVDPQKYADRLVHQGYLRECQRHRDATVVVLNHADRLSAADVRQVGADLRRLLAADGLAGVPVLVTSALYEEGVGALRATLETTVAQRQVMLHRLSGDVHRVVGDLSDLVRPEESAYGVRRSRLRRLTDALAETAGVARIADATERAYRHRAAAATGWHLIRGWWLVRRWRRLRPDRPRRPHRTEGSAGAETTGSDRHFPIEATSLPAPRAADRSAVALAVRAVADQASAGMPAPWPNAVTAAARSRLTEVPDALDRAVARIDPDLSRQPVWWGLVGAGQWLATAFAAVGLVWLLVGLAAAALGFRPEYPEAGAVPMPALMLVGGPLLGFLASVLIKPVIKVAARRARDRVANRLRAAVADVGNEYVVAPVNNVLAAYEAARAAFTRAASAD
jgi:GTP-binding protein EngB required for normal cell division